MATTAQLYNNGLTKIINGEIQLESTPIKVALLADTYSMDLSGEFVSEVLMDEITNTSGSVYVAGGETLTGSVVSNPSLGVVMWDADDVLWATASFTARYAVIYADLGTDAVSPLIALIDFESNQTVAAADFPITWDADGILRFS